MSTVAVAVVMVAAAAWMVLAVAARAEKSEGVLAAESSGVTSGLLCR